MSNRLTTAEKEQLQHAILEHRFAKQRNDLIAKKYVAGNKIYDFLVPQEIREKMNGIPAEFLRMNNYLYIRNSKYFKFDDSICFDAPRPCPYDSINLPQTMPDRELMKLRALVADYKEVINQLNILAGEVDKAHKEIGQILKNTSSISSLLKTWPEIEIFVDKLGLNQASPGKQLAPVIAELNKNLGLPPKE